MYVKIGGCRHGDDDMFVFRRQKMLLLPRMRLPLMLLGCLVVMPGVSEGVGVRVREHWMRLNIHLDLQQPLLGGWQIQLDLDQPASDIRVWRAEAKKNGSDSRRWILENASYNGDLRKGRHSFKIQLNFDGLDSPRCVRAWLVGVEEENPCSSPASSLPPTSVTKTATTPRPVQATTTTIQRSDIDYRLTSQVAPQSNPTPTTPPRVTTRSDSHYGEPTFASSPSHTVPDGAILGHVRFRRPEMFSGLVRLQAPTDFNGWAIKLVFSSPVYRLRALRADVSWTSADGRVHVLTSKPFASHIAAGEVVEFVFRARTRRSNTPEHIYALLTSDIDQLLADVTSTPMPTPTPGPTPIPRLVKTVTPGSVESFETSTLSTTSKKPGMDISPPTPVAPGNYDYRKVVQKSNAFYQRLCQDDLWWPDTQQDDGARLNLTKMAAATASTLMLGLFENKRAYVESGEGDVLLDTIRCLLDTLVSHLYEHLSVSGSEGSVRGERQILSPSSPAGVDVTAEVAATLAGGALFLRNNRAYARNLIKHARVLYDFAYSTQKLEAADKQRHSIDELGWAACWLYAYTREDRYLEHALQLIPTHPLSELSWQDRSPAYMYLLYKLHKDPTAQRKLEQFVDFWIDEVPRTPRGLAWLKQRAPNSLVANAAFIAVSAASQGIREMEGREFARRQIDHMLGAAGHSFVVGYGHQPPQHPSYQATACHDPSERCSEVVGGHAIQDLDLTGALVSGPDLDGTWQDLKDKPEWTGVRLDYNAGFQGALTGLLMLK